MKRRWLVGLVSVLILFTGVLLFNLLWPDRLTSETSIRRWARAAGDRDPKIRQQANERFEKAKDPVRVCLVLLQMEPTYWERLYADHAPKILPKLPTQIARRLPLPDLNAYRNYRSLAVERLGQLGPKASNAVPNLIALLNNSDQFLETSTVRTLGRIGPGAAPAVPRLVQSIEDFLEGGPTTGGVLRLPSLPPDPSANISRAPVSPTTKTRPASRETRLPANVSGALISPTLTRRGFPWSEPFEEVTALGAIGVRDDAVIKILDRCLTNRSPVIQLRAAEAIWKIEHNPKRLLPVLSKWTIVSRDPPSQFGVPSQSVYRRQAVELITQIAEADRQALRILDGLVRDEDISIRLAASRTLLKLDGQADTYVRVRSEVLKEGNEEYRWLCLEDLERFPGQRDITLPLILGALKDESNRIRGKAAMTLGNLGAAARAASPALQEALKDSHSNVREAAAAALKKID